MKDFLCICGHLKIKHLTWKQFRVQRCEICIAPVLDKIRVDDHDTYIIQAAWHDYKADNLKYLEELYEASHK
jgi:hypothetical protein